MSNPCLVEPVRAPAGAPRVGLRNVFAFLLTGLLLAAGVAQAGADEVSAPLDLNRATAAELEMLPGIGIAKAAAIVAARDARGGFESVEELEAVRGIGPALLAKLRPLVVVGPERPAAGGRTAKR